MTRLFIHIAEDESESDRRVVDTVHRLKRGEPVQPEEHVPLRPGASSSRR